MTIVPLSLLTARARGRANAILRQQKHRHTLPPFTQPYAGIAVDDYVINNGQPRLDRGYGVMSDTFGYATSITTGSGRPTAVSIDTEATARFLPQSQYMNSTNWWPVGGSATTYPAMTFTGGGDPVLDAGYSYHRGKPRYSNPAFTYNGSGYSHFQIAASPPATQSCTLIWVLVPHDGKYAYWPLFDNEVYGVNRMVIRYAKGAVQLFFGDGLVANLETALDPGEPMIVAVGVNTTTNKGGIFVTDRKRSSKGFRIPTNASLNGSGYIGVGLTSTAVDLQKEGDFDLLEFNYYNTGLTANKIETIITRLSAAYGVTK